jgi:DNA helicase-2/ATP-dependent DNA helicase PcrA
LNYRSSQKILDASNKLIKNNCNRIDKQLVTEKKEGEFVYLYKGESSEDEANFIAKEINKITNKYQYKEIAILYRSNYLSRNIETSLINYNIPYIIYGGVKFYQRKEIKDIVAYLKLIVNEKDELSLKRIINVPKRNIGQTTIDNINLYAMQNNLTFFEALNESYTSTDLP